MRKAIKFWTSAQLVCFKFFLKIGEKLWNYTKYEKIYEQKFVLTNNSEQNIQNKVQKPSKIG